MTPAGLLRDLRLRLALVALTLAAALDLAGRVPLRLDLTRDGRNGLSEAARGAVRGLDRPLVARVFFSGDLAPPYHAHREALLDLLGALADAGPVEVIDVDPGDDPALGALAEGWGVPPVTLAVRTAQRQEARRVYLGVAFASGDRQVALPALTAIPRMEAEVVGAIRAVTRPARERPSIGWWSGHGEPRPELEPARSPLRALAGDLGARGPLRSVGSPIPDDVDVLVIAAPTEPVPPADLDALRAFRARGGDALVFVSSAGPDADGLRLVDRPTGLATWLLEEGLALGPEVVLDRAQAEVLAAPHTAGGRTAVVRATHPLAPVTTDLDRASPVVRPLGRLVLPFASPLGPLPGADAEVWARTGPASRATLARPSLDPAALASPGADEAPGPFPVVAATTRADPPRRLVAVGSGDAVANNPDLVRNAVDWLTEDEDLLLLRGRGDGDPPRELPSAAARRVAGAAMVGVPLALVALLGLVGRRLP